MLSFTLQRGNLDAVGKVISGFQYAHAAANLGALKPSSAHRPPPVMSNAPEKSVAMEFPEPDPLLNRPRLEFFFEIFNIPDLREPLSSSALYRGFIDRYELLSMSSCGRTVFAIRRAREYVLRNYLSGIFLSGGFQINSLTPPQVFRFTAQQVFRQFVNIVFFVASSHGQPADHFPVLIESQALKTFEPHHEFSEHLSCCLTDFSLLAQVIFYKNR